MSSTSSDPATWCSFEEAHASFAKHAEWSGLGFVFGKDDPFAGVDLDDCLDEDGKLLWGRDIVEGLKTYTEVSPSGRGLKMFLEGDKPAQANCRKDGFGPTGRGKVEVYDSKRFFTVTGNHLAGSPRSIEGRQQDLVAMCHWMWPQQNGTQPWTTRDENTNDERRFADCLASMLAMDIPDHKDGSHRLFAACCRCVEHDLSDTEALECIGRYAVHVPFPQRWNDEAIVRRIRDAEKRCQRGLALRPGHASSSDLGAEESGPRCLPVGDLIERYPTLRTPVIDGLLRQGESERTVNRILPDGLGSRISLLEPQRFLNGDSFALVGKG